MPHRSTRVHLLSVVAAFGLLVNGCGGDSGTSATPPAQASDHHAAAGSSDDDHDHGHEHAGVEAEAPMTVGIEVTPDAKAGANLQVTTTGFRWTPEHASGEHTAGEGHAHVYVDGEKLGRLYGDWMHLDLDAGDHDIRVTLNSNDHRDYLVDGETVETSSQVTLDHTTPPGEGAASMTPEALAADLCDLSERARRDTAGAAEHFNGQLHGPLHDVADVLITSDRSQAGEVMVAKASVEQLIAAPTTDGDELANALIELSRKLPGGHTCRG